jgi:hypothetical protein
LANQTVTFPNTAYNVGFGKRISAALLSWDYDAVPGEEVLTISGQEKWPMLFGNWVRIGISRFLLENTSFSLEDGLTGRTVSKWASSALRSS